MGMIRWIPCWLAIFGAIAAMAEGPAASTAEPQGDLKTMTVAQLLAEFHDNTGKLTTPESQRRVDLVNALRRAGPPLIEALRVDLADADFNVERRALYVLSRLGNKARPLATEIMKAAESTDAGVRATSLSVLARLRDPRSFELIARAMHDPAARVRAAVLRDGSLALADAPFALAVLALSDSDATVRNQAIYQLCFSKDKRAVAYLAPHLEDENLLHYVVWQGVKTGHRNCDATVQALDYLVNGVYQTPDKKTQEEKDAQVKQWREWWKDKGAAFDAALYEEPEVKKLLK